MNWNIFRSNSCQPIQNEKSSSGYSNDQTNIANQSSSAGVNYGSSSSRLSAVDNNLGLLLLKILLKDILVFVHFCLINLKTLLLFLKCN